MAKKKAAKAWWYGNAINARKVCRVKGHMLNKGGFCKRCRTIVRSPKERSTRFW